MNIAFRTDSSFKLGTGHIHRCLSLAREFKKKKVKIYFFCGDEAGNINKLIKNEFTLCELPKLIIKNISTNKQNNIDANLTLRLIKKYNIDLIFLDHYFLNGKWEKKVSKFCKIVFISDFINRKSFCNYYLNYNIFYENKEISKKLLDPDCKRLIGPDYSIIKNSYHIKSRKVQNKITVFMGGVDAKNITSKIVNILSSKLFNKVKKLIIIGVRNKKRNQIINQTKKLRNFNTTIGNQKNLYSFFKDSKLVVTSVGMSMYEHLTLGLNSLVIPQNKIQKKIINNLSSLNIFNYIRDIKYLNSAYLNKRLNQKKIANKNKILKDLFDSKGASRVVDYFIEQNIIKNAKLKKVSEIDKFFLYKLVNDPQVIKNSLGNKLIDYKEHEKWFQKTMRNNNSRMFIFRTPKHKLGQVRFDNIAKDKTFITYSVSNEFREKNAGYSMLSLALKKNIFNTPIYAIVKKNNEASNKIFKKLGFILLRNYQKNNFIYYLKKN